MRTQMSSHSWSVKSSIIQPKPTILVLPNPFKTKPNQTSIPCVVSIHHLQHKKTQAFQPIHSCKTPPNSLFFDSPTMASLNTITPQNLSHLAKPINNFKPKFLSIHIKGLSGSSLPTCNLNRPPKTGFSSKNWAIPSVPDDNFDVIPVNSSDFTDQQDGLMCGIDREQEEKSLNQVVGFANEGRLSFDGGVGDVQSFPAAGYGDDQGSDDKLLDRAINATIVLAASSFAITKLLTIDHDYWHGWTLFEILRYAPQHNWTAYEEALKTNPVLAKMMISGVVYSLGDWIAQCYEGKPLFEFDRARMFRSGLVGFSLHGSLSHYYYHFCEALFPSKDWWVVPAKVAFDQTAWSAIWNSIYYVVLGFLRFESPASIFSELKATFFPLLTAGWKLWPFAHLITYGVIPVEQRLLWVDCVELIWVTILSTYSNEQSEARNSEASTETNIKPSSTAPKE